jgi:hypothetical protein
LLEEIQLSHLANSALLLLLLLSLELLAGDHLVVVVLASHSSLGLCFPDRHRGCFLANKPLVALGGLLGRPLARRFPSPVSSLALGAAQISAGTTEIA